MVDQAGQAVAQFTEEMVQAATDTLLHEIGGYIEDIPDEPSFIARMVLEAGLRAATARA